MHIENDNGSRKCLLDVDYDKELVHNVNKMHTSAASCYLWPIWTSAHINQHGCHWGIALTSVTVFRRHGDGFLSEQQRAKQTSREKGNADPRKSDVGRRCGCRGGCRLRFGVEYESDAQSSICIGVFGAASP